MINGSYVDYLFGVATGWLGWPPDVAWRTPIPQIMLALNARLEWMNPSKTPPPKPSKATIAERLKARLRGQRE